MNKVFLIGNGFDLAHGLKTKYSDFILWYFNEAIQSFKSRKSNVFDDDLITIQNDGYTTPIIDTIEQLNELTNNKLVVINFKHYFFRDFVRKLEGLRWVDIEYQYYLELIKVYKYSHNDDTEPGVSMELINLNNCFNSVKKKLIEYLETIEISWKIVKPQIQEHLHNELIKNSTNSHNLFIIFNYTNTIKLYQNYLNDVPHQIVYIHGRLGNEKNPIIFGYGDEMDEYYSKLERLNINQYLNNIKSFSYSLTTNYQDCILFLASRPYSVSIMGHSCGISDRLLLNTIFTDDHCEEIKIYYYQKNDSENDYFEKNQEISRHFPPEKKARMREIIKPLPLSLPLT